MRKLKKKQVVNRFGEFPARFLENYFKKGRQNDTMSVWVTASTKKSGFITAVYDLSKVRPKYYYYTK